MNTTLDFSWDSVNGATKYQLQRSTDGTNFSTITTVMATSYSYNPPAGQSYFRVQALDVNSNIISISNIVSFLMVHGQQKFDTNQVVITPVTHNLKKQFDTRQKVITPVTANLRRNFDTQQIVITPVTHNVQKKIDTKQIVITPVKRYIKTSFDTRQFVVTRQVISRRSVEFDTKQVVITPVGKRQSLFDTRQVIPISIRRGTSLFDTKQKVARPKPKTTIFDTKQNVVYPSAVGLEFMTPDYLPQTFKRPVPLNGSTCSHDYNLTVDESAADCKFMTNYLSSNTSLMTDIKTKLAGRQTIYRRLLNLSVRG
ncbi:hypothetical protein [Neomoorella thermoacetica]|uniref:hypothetical protein n=1 Tax=Neomoorella thermoacetica TaxID=1525 RepID=UPI001E5402E1|nr:hypothetical protein [Moorella thermoacetica]